MKIEIKSIMKFGDCIQIIGEIPAIEYSGGCKVNYATETCITDVKEKLAIPRLGEGKIEFNE